MNLRLLASTPLLALMVACAPVDNTDNAIDGPSVRMDVPATLSGVVDPGAPAATKPLLLKTVNQAASSGDCSSYLSQDVSNRFAENGYFMTKFLVGMSQSVTCSSDALIKALLSNAKPIINAGIQTLDIDPNSVDPVTHMNVVEDTTTVAGETTYKVWLYWGGNYTADQVVTGVGVKKIYLTWTTDEVGTTGQLMWVDLDQSNAGALDNMRIDFIRRADLQQNDIFMQFSTGGGNTFKIDGFRAKVIKNIAVDGTVDYVAQGRMQLGGQIMSYLDRYEAGGSAVGSAAASFLASPYLTVNAISDNIGKGAAIAEFNGFAVPLFDSANLSSPAFDFGPYEYNLRDKGYFETDGTMTWRNKSVLGATHEGAGNRNPGSIPYSALEDTVANGGLNLGSGYFASTCTDTIDSNCTALMQAIYDQGIFDGGVAYNSASSEPIDTGSDTRPSELALLGDSPSDYLDAVFVQIGDDGTVTYAVPQQ